MQSRFDRVIDRHNTDSIKYDFARRFGKPADILPLWVADMDFQAPEQVIACLEQRCRHGIFGYSDKKEEYFQAVAGWMEDSFRWQVKPEWLVKTSGVVHAICSAIRALTDPGDAVLIQQPVYHPFPEIIKNNRRKLVVNQLQYREGRYSIDWEDFSEKVVRQQVRMFILCSPHNPVGRVWTADELKRMGDICRKNNVIVIADEIHADFVYRQHKHQVFANLQPEFADMTVTCTAPTKTFNLAGLQIANIFITDSRLRGRFKREIAAAGTNHVGIMGLDACQAAYNSGRAWLDDLLVYLQGNIKLLSDYIKSELPLVSLVDIEGTYLAWLDFHRTGLDDAELDRRLVEKGRLWLDPGTRFGAGGESFQRMNIACPSSVLKEALDRLSIALS